ncbi:hypothetical protein JCGZ_03733 [Jatropha curcas]|uniref:Uncharacterized protein n=1 Tax=Jatropha curcas TaxID=180498 RepID=A0A067KTA2_JATCU|nr:hypothetical protein JCGZ_03733 [Jatropha curcas]
MRLFFIEQLHDATVLSTRINDKEFRHATVLHRTAAWNEVGHHGFIRAVHETVGHMGDQHPVCI